MAQQRAQALELYTFLQSSDPTLAFLNERNKCYVDVVNVLKTKHMRVVYGFGFGTNPIGSDAAPTDGKLLMLQGDGNADIGPSLPLCLLSTAVEEE